MCLLIPQVKVWIYHVYACWCDWQCRPPAEIIEESGVAFMEREARSGKRNIRPLADHLPNLVCSAEFRHHSPTAKLVLLLLL